MRHPMQLFGAGFGLFAVVLMSVALAFTGLSSGKPVTGTSYQVRSPRTTETTDGPASGPQSPTPATSARSDLLEQDGVMTQQMSTPNASGPMQDGRIQEPMLQHSLDAGYVRALEQHHDDIDRMLARNQ